jgi:hypothetical protein
MHFRSLINVSHTAFQPHPTDDNLELYGAGRLDAEEGARIEEHLLACDQCCARVAPSDETVVVLRATPCR